MRAGDSPWILFFTTVLSHVTLIPTPVMLFQRRQHFEFCVSIFSFASSFLYHACESFQTDILLSEKQWHRLDNMGVIAMLGLLFVFVSNFTRLSVDLTCKYAVVLLSVVFQQRNPWDIRLTVVPIILFSFIPVGYNCILHHRLPQLQVRNMLIGLCFIFLAVPFFILGLNDAEDPYRMFHGLWHFFGGVSSYYFWQMTKPLTVSGEVDRFSRSRSACSVVLLKGEGSPLV